jgi:hypothetical protein
MKVLLPSRTGYCVWGVEGNAGVEIVEDFVNLLNLVVGRSCGSEAGKGYWRRQRHTLRLWRRCLPDGQGSRSSRGCVRSPFDFDRHEPQMRALELGVSTVPFDPTTPRLTVTLSIGRLGGIMRRASAEPVLLPLRRPGGVMRRKMIDPLQF